MSSIRLFLLLAHHLAGLKLLNEKLINYAKMSAHWLNITATIILS